MAPHPWRPTKRQRPNEPGSSRVPVDKEEDKKQVPKFAYIRAYEATLLYDSDAPAGTVGTRGEDQGNGRGTGKQTGGLIKWAGSFQDDGEDEIEGEGGRREVWADRYDIIHLLSSLPSASSSRNTDTAARFGATARNVQSINSEAAPSPTASSSSSTSAASWPDEPSDEEAFFDLSGDEAIAAYQREKRRKWVEELRERRIRELDAEEESGDGQASDEEEEQIQPQTLTLMHHTALSLFRSPNPAQLEAKIFAHHATDARFAFLRAAKTSAASSNLAKAWEKAKYDAKVELGLVKVSVKAKGAATQIMGLGYGSSDSEDDEQDDAEIEGKEAADEEADAGEGVEDRPAPPNETAPPSPPPPPPPPNGSTPPPPREPENDAVPAPPLPSPGIAQDPIAAGRIANNDDHDEQAQQKQAERKARMEAWKKDKERKRLQALHDGDA